MSENIENTDIRYLDCPCCLEPTVPEAEKGCSDCFYGEPHECKIESLWYDGQEARCPACGCLATVSTDGEETLYVKWTCQEWDDVECSCTGCK